MIALLIAAAVHQCVAPRAAYEAVEPVHLTRAQWNQAFLYADCVCGRLGWEDTDPVPDAHGRDRLYPVCVRRGTGWNWRRA